MIAKTGSTSSNNLTLKVIRSEADLGFNVRFHVDRGSTKWIAENDLNKYVPAEIESIVVPCNYALNDPIARLDPNGMWVEFANGWKTDDDEEIKKVPERLQQVQRPASDENLGFSRGIADGFTAGIGNTVDFFKSLGTTDGWRDLGKGVVNIAHISNVSSPQGILLRSKLTDATIDYTLNIPNMSTYEIGYDLGFGTEKALEFALTRRRYTSSKNRIGCSKLWEFQQIFHHSIH